MTIASCLRRGARLACGALAALLVAACGSGTIESELSPARFVAFGDAFGDVGFAGDNARYTVNDNSTNVWTQQLASRFNQSLVAQSKGGTGYARGNARVLAEPDAAGNAETLTLKEQIDAFVAAGDRFSERDVVLLAAGTADVLAENFASGAATETRRIANVEQAGRDYAAQARRLVGLGAKYVVVAGVYDLGRSPLAAATGRRAQLSDLSLRFNDALLVSIVDLGANVLYVDAAYFTNLMIGSPGAYGIRDVTSVACTSVNPGAGIGTGTGQVDASRCTAATIAPDTDYNATLFADAVYLTPNPQRQFGNYAYDRLRSRW